MKLGKLRTIVSLFTVAAVAGVVALAIPANGGGTTDNRFITVTGIGTVAVVPDALRFNATISTVGATNSAALSTASKSAAAIRSVLKEAGIASKDIRSANISVYPEYTWSQEAGTKIIGYRASQSFDVVLRATAKAGKIIEMVILAGGDNVQIGGVAPITLNLSVGAEAARAAAVADAKLKAISYAKLVGTSIGKVLSLEEQSPAYSSPFPVGKASADASTVEIDLGEQNLTVSITVRWALGS
jgi:uncharacterized protein YggE